MARTRALLTDTERERIADDGNPQRRYEAVSRVRRRITEELGTDLEILADGHPELLAELREVVGNAPAPDAEADDGGRDAEVAE